MKTYKVIYKLKPMSQNVKVKVDESVLKHVVNYLTSLLKISKTPSVGLLRLAIDVCHVCGYVKDVALVNVNDSSFVTCLDMVKKVLKVLNVLGVVELVEPGIVNVVDVDKLLQFKKKYEALDEKVKEYYTSDKTSLTKIEKVETEVKASTSTSVSTSSTSSTQGLSKKIVVKKESEKKRTTRRGGGGGGGMDITKFL